MKKTMETRIKIEKARLTELYKDMDPESQQLAAGLIDRAAWMRVQCEDMESFLQENGWTEPFRQSPNLPPYDRARPQGQAYQSMNANYQKIIKQLNSMLPKDATPVSDGFDEFVNSRD